MARLPNSEIVERMRGGLLVWYDCNKRDLPWRHSKDPYAVWVSEIMLQQTRVAVVIDRYTTFLQRFPTIAALAAADEQDVLALWSGLGYYRRARMLHKAAKTLVAEHGGNMPAKAEELRKLAGIGSYTAAAIASIAHGEAIAVVDGNVERVLSRIRGWESHDTVGEAAVRRKVEELAAALVDPLRAGDFNQAIMELGATICAPRNPQCLVCPWAKECRTMGEHKTPKRAPMTSREIACALIVRDGDAGAEVLLVQRSENNRVMPAMWELPSLPNGAVIASDVRFMVRHAIMQVNYIVQVCAVDERDLPSLVEHGSEQHWVLLGQTAEMALTGLARKVLGKVRPRAATKSGSIHPSS